MQKIASNENIDEICSLRIFQQEEIKILNFTDNEKTNLFEETKEFLKEHLNKDVIFFIEVIDKKIVATCGIQIINYMPKFMKNGITGYICDVYTLPDYRKKGIQRNLINLTVEFAKEKNVTKLELYTSNEDMVNIYKNLGFSIENYIMYKDI